MRVFVATPAYNTVHVPMHSVPDRINAAQLTIPRCRFNSIKCEHGLAGLREYCRDWDDRLKVFKDSPKHNWASHAADSFGYMAMGYKQTAKPEPTPRQPLYKPLSAMSYDEFDDDIEITYQGTKSSRPIGGREGPTGYDVSPIAIYVSKGRLCARLQRIPQAREWRVHGSISQVSHRALPIPRGHRL